MRFYLTGSRDVTMIETLDGSMSTWTDLIRDTEEEHPVNQTYD